MKTTPNHCGCGIEGISSCLGMLGEGKGFRTEYNRLVEAAMRRFGQPKEEIEFIIRHALDCKVVRLVNKGKKTYVELT